MAKYTNKGLVKHAENALGLRTKYMWGGVLRSITDGYIKTLRGIYGVGPATGYTEKRYAQLAQYAGKGYYGCDCVGLIKSYYWSGKPDGGTGSGATPSKHSAPPALPISWPCRACIWASSMASCRGCWPGWGGAGPPWPREAPCRSPPPDSTC